MASSKSSSRQLQVKLVTTKDDLAVPDTVLTVPASIDPSGLNQLLQKMLEEAKEDYEEAGLGSRRFEFILADDFIRGALWEFVEKRPEISTESALDIRYAIFLETDFS